MGEAGAIAGATERGARLPAWLPDQTLTSADQCFWFLMGVWLCAVARTGTPWAGMWEMPVFDNEVACIGPVRALR